MASTIERKQFAIFGGIFIAVVSMLALVYFLFLRQEYVVLFSDLREQDTAQIVAELERVGLEHRIAGGGHTIMVPDDTIEEARVAIAGSEIALGGIVGFELFDQSDMGLTDFAQQVNFQRAIQGELARTIMMMDGISFARVHISLPERRLFRAESAGPRAAVTIQPQPGQAIGPSSVVGIQRLVASAVSDLEPGEVSVLDQNGQLISPALAASNEDVVLDEKSALEAYYEARAVQAVAPFLAGTDYVVRVSAIRLAASRPSAGSTSTSPDVAAPAGPAAPARDFALNAALRTEFELAPQDRSAISEAMAQAIGLDAAIGDTIRFEVADLETPVGLPSESVLAQTPAQAAPPLGAQPQTGSHWTIDLLFSRWTLLGLLLALVIALPLWRQRSRMSQDERLDFAEQIELLLADRQERERD